MNGCKRVILHLVFDGVLFDMVYPRFEQMDEYENVYLFGGLGVNKKELKYIKNSDNIISADSREEWGRVINDPKNDIIYFHGLWKSYLPAVDYIRKEAIVMWWCYGMEIYENMFGWSPLLHLKVYKPKTFCFLLKTKSFRSALSMILMYNFPKVYDRLKSCYYTIKGKRNMLKEMLSRIDYIFTPLPVEFDLLKKEHSYIKAKPFRLIVSRTIPNIEYHNWTGNILLEHSANISNNHLDLIAEMRKLNFKERDIFIPLSYGSEIMAEEIKKKAFFDGANVHFLLEVMPVTEYQQLLSGCTHALFGMTRQSGLGNINYCLRNGVKVFLFEDGVLYKQLKQDGYYVFSIEKDLDDCSIQEPLSIEMAKHNYSLFFRMHPVVSEGYQQQLNQILAN